MLRIISVLAISLWTGMGWAADKNLKTDQQKLGYLMGVQTMFQWAQGGLDIEAGDIDLKAMMMGLEDGLNGKTPRLTPQEMNAVGQKFQETLRTRRAEAANKNRAAGQKWLADNKKKKGVKVTQSGLQYKVVTKGKGKKPAASDTVRVHYKGTLINGKEFDSSYARNQPAEFPLGGVIKGWTEVLQLMPEGSKWMVYIPSDLAYGTRGSGRLIGPNETLIFEIELLKVL